MDNELDKSGEHPSASSTMIFKNLVKSAVADITPTEPIPLNGFAQRKGPFRDIASRLEANVILFGDNEHTVALISIDSLFSSVLLRTSIEERLDKLSIQSIKQIAIVASHTHFAPSLDPEKPLLGTCDTQYLNLVVNRICDAIVKVVNEKGEFPNAHYATTKLQGSVYRRRKIDYFHLKTLAKKSETVQAPDRRIRHNKQLQLLMIKDDAGRPISVIWSWPCHAVSSPDQLSVSADFPGQVRDALRASLNDPSLPILYFPGFAGDIRPDTTRSWMHPMSLRAYPGSFVDQFAPMTIQTFNAFCEKCCVASCSILDTTKGIDVSNTVTLTRSEIPLTELLEGSAENQGSMPAMHFSSGDLTIFLAGAEVCSGYYDLVGFDKNKPLFVSGYLDRCFGYFPTNEQLLAGGYEADRFRQYFAVNGHFRDDLEHRFSECLKDLNYE